MEFLKGETDPVGDCENFAAGIDVHGADQFLGDSKKCTWYSRIECYGNTAEHANELRDKVLALLVGTQPIYDEAKRTAELERALSGMLFAFDDGVGLDWSEDLLDFARKLTPAVEFQSSAKSVEAE